MGDRKDQFLIMGITLLILCGCARTTGRGVIDANPAYIDCSIPLTYEISVPESKKTGLKDVFLMNEPISVLIYFDIKEGCLIDKEIFLFVNDDLKETINSSKDIKNNTYNFTFVPEIKNTKEVINIYLETNSTSREPQVDGSLNWDVKEITEPFKERIYSIEVISSTEQLALERSSKSLEQSEIAINKSEESNKIANLSLAESRIANKLAESANDKSEIANNLALYSFILAIFAFGFGIAKSSQERTNKE